MNWRYDLGDPAVRLFTEFQARFGRMDIPADARVLELGCAETDFLERLQEQNPGYRLTGVDVHPQPRPNVIVGSAMDPDLFPPETFDAIILLGALEHFGLGYYGDPIAPAEDGDVRTMQNVGRWLKPGGWVYLDVPCNPSGYITENRHFRVFAPGEIGPRLLAPAGVQETARAYAWPDPGWIWCEEPTVFLSPYHYVAVHAVKG